MKKSVKKNIGVTSRRSFLQACVRCSAVFHSLPCLLSGCTIHDEVNSNKPIEKIALQLVFCHSSSNMASWPYKGYDFHSRKNELTALLKNNCPNVKFIINSVRNEKEAEKVIHSTKNHNGFIVYILGLIGSVPRLFSESGMPTVFIDDLFGGTGSYLVSFAAAKRRKLKTIGVSSSSFDDVVDAVNYLVCLGKTRNAHILEVGGGRGYWGHVPIRHIKKQFGTTIHQIGFDEFNSYYKRAKRNEVLLQADKWKNEAVDIIEPHNDDIEKSAAMYLAMNGMLNEYQAEAITINCLGGFYSKTLHAYPCLGFFQLLNEGLIGACEADMCSTMTLLLMKNLIARPGFISDPVIDTATNRIIYAHCVGSNKVFGPKAESSDYIIRSHAEDRKGASVQTLMPVNEIVTTLLFHPIKEKVILHQGKTVENYDIERGCRTKIAAEVLGDIKKLQDYWDEWSWHRVTFFGDYKEQVYQLASLIGYEVVEEA